MSEKCNCFEHKATDLKDFLFTFKIVEKVKFIPEEFRNVCLKPLFRVVLVTNETKTVNVTLSFKFFDFSKNGLLLDPCL